MNDLSWLTFSLVGPGRVGTSLASWACALGARLHEVGGRDIERARALADRFGARAVPWPEVESGACDLVWLTVPDPVLPEVAAALARNPQATVAIHASGLLGPEPLAPLRDVACRIGGLHPLKAFPRPFPEPAAARGVFFGLCGDPEALELGGRLVAAWGGTAREIPTSQRDAYHFAASLAAGGIVTLLALAEDLAGRADLPDAVRAGYLELARGALAEAASAARSARAITGPAARGDAQSVARHRDAVQRLDARRWPAVRALLELTLELGSVADSEGERRVRELLDR